MVPVACSADRMEVCANMRRKKLLLGTDPAVKFASSRAGLFIPPRSRARPPRGGLTYFVDFYTCELEGEESGFEF